MWITIATSAGVVATALFVTSALPMLVKAARTKNLASYSGGNLLIANFGNLTQIVYLTTVPPGPIWVLHGFNTLASATMLTWWLRHRAPAATAITRAAAPQPAHAGGADEQQPSVQGRALRRHPP